ncbi:MAG: hypothetical protein J7L12_03450 [Desulfurococcales archaeon]|nr:hypothetical protein [Desulfurococcales archaeon]
MVNNDLSLLSIATLRVMLGETPPSCRSGISPVVTAVMLILISIAVAVVTYTVVSGYITVREPGTAVASSVIRIDAYSLQGRLLKLYISNQGPAEAEVSAIYYEDSRKAIKLKPPTFESGTAEVWGGDVWAPDPYTMKLTREVSGRLISDDFTAKDTAEWDYSYVNYYNAWSAIRNGQDGLELFSKSKRQRHWAVRGIVTKYPIDFSGPLVIIVDLEKTSCNIPDGDAARAYFAACLYLTASNSSRNPYYNYPWVALKLYPREGKTEAQLFARDSSGTLLFWERCSIYNWSSGAGTEPRIRAALVFNESSRVYYYAWLYNGNEPLRYVSGSWSSSVISDLRRRGKVYLYLTIDNSEKYTREVLVRYIRVSKGANITIKNVEEGWWLRLRELLSNTELKN